MYLKASMCQYNWEFTVQTCSRMLQPGPWHRRRWWCHVHHGSSWTLLCETSPGPPCPTTAAKQTATTELLFMINTTQSQKNCAILFLSELCQISTVENFWHKDVHSFSTSPNLSMHYRVKHRCCKLLHNAVIISLETWPKQKLLVWVKFTGNPYLYTTCITIMWKAAIGIHASLCLL